MNIFQIAIHSSFLIVEIDSIEKRWFCKQKPPLDWNCLGKPFSRLLTQKFKNKIEHRALIPIVIPRLDTHRGGKLDFKNFL